MRRALALVLLLVALAACAATRPSDAEDLTTAGKRDEVAGLALTQALLALPEIANVRAAAAAGAWVPARAGCQHVAFDFRQPVDHGHPDGPRFMQRAVLSHCDWQRPMVFSPDGYGLEVDFFVPDLVERLDANWLWVEHRFFGTSVPASDPERATLRIAQAAADDHAVVRALRALYPARWISTGASKGGMTAIFHRRFFPDDIDGTIAYVAPFVAGAPDQRFVPFVDALGTPDCRARMARFQRAALGARGAIVEELALMGLQVSDAARRVDEAAVLFRFMSWQYGGGCAALPAGDSPGELLSALLYVDALRSDEDRAGFDSYYAHTRTELGFPAHPTTGIEDLVPGALEPTPAAYDPAPLAEVRRFIRERLERVVFVYGGDDPWTAAAAEPDPARDAWSFVAPGVGHGASLEDLTATDRQRALLRLTAWAGSTPIQPQAATLDADRLGRWRARVALQQARAGTP